MPTSDQHDTIIDHAQLPGFILLWRKLMHHPWWDRPQELRAFIYCLMWARHTPGQVKLHGKRRYVPAGSFRTSVRILADQLNETRYFVEKFLAEGEAHGELKWDRQRGSRDGILHVVNYEQYQAIPQDTLGRLIGFLIDSQSAELLRQLETLGKPRLLRLRGLIDTLLSDAESDTRQTVTRHSSDRIQQVVTTLPTTTEVGTTVPSTVIHNPVDNPNGNTAGAIALDTNPTPTDDFPSDPDKRLTRWAAEICHAHQRATNNHQPPSPAALDRARRAVKSYAGDPQDIVDFVYARTADACRKNPSDPPRYPHYGLAAWERGGAAECSREPARRDPDSDSGHRAYHEPVVSKPPEPLTDEQVRLNVERLRAITSRLDIGNGPSVRPKK